METKLRGTSQNFYFEHSRDGTVCLFAESENDFAITNQTERLRITQALIGVRTRLSGQPRERATS